MNNSFDLALNYLTYQSRTIKEVKDYLVKKKFNKKVIDETIQKLIEYNYLNDLNYIKQYYETNKLGKKYGKKRIRYQLSKKGIKEEDLTELDKLLSPEEESDYCYYHFQKGLEKTIGLPKNKRSQKIISSLQSKGFSYSTYQNFLYDLPDEEIDKEVLKKEITKVFKRFKNRGYQDRELKNRIVRSLLNKGYSYSDISDLIDEFI